MANDETISFMSFTFEIGLESMDSRVGTLITAKSSQKIFGGIKPFNWIEMKRNWEHLKNIYFSKLARGRTVDILLEVHHHELMYSIKEVVGKWSAVSQTYSTRLDNNGEIRWVHRYQLLSY